MHRDTAHEKVENTVRGRFSAYTETLFLTLTLKKHFALSNGLSESPCSIRSFGLARKCETFQHNPSEHIQTRQIMAVPNVLRNST